MGGFYLGAFGIGGFALASLTCIVFVLQPRNTGSGQTAEASENTNSSRPYVSVIDSGVHDQGDLASGDFDGDGNRDLAVIVGNSWKTNVYLIKNEGGRAFSQPSLIRSYDDGHKTESVSITSGDFDNDGLTDLAISYKGYQHSRVGHDLVVRVLYNDGRGNFSEGQ